MDFVLLLFFFFLTFWKIINNQPKGTNTPNGGAPTRRGLGRLISPQTQSSEFYRSTLSRGRGEREAPSPPRPPGRGISSIPIIGYDSRHEKKSGFLAFLWFWDSAWSTAFFERQFGTGRFCWFRQISSFLCYLNLGYVLKFNESGRCVWIWGTCKVLFSIHEFGLCFWSLTHVNVILRYVWIVTEADDLFEFWRSLMLFMNMFHYVLLILMKLDQVVLLM